MDRASLGGVLGRLVARAARARGFLASESVCAISPLDPSPAAWTLPRSLSGRTTITVVWPDICNHLSWRPPCHLAPPLQ